AEGQLGRLGVVPDEAVGDHLGDGGPVADDEAPEAPLAAEDLLQEVPVGRAGDAVDLVEGGHHRADAGLGGRVEGWQVDLPQGALGEVHRVVVAAAFGGAVGGQVLDAGEDRVGGGQVAALEAADPGRGPGAAEVRGLARALG